MKKSLNYDDITQFIKKLPIFFLKLTVNLSPNDRPAEGGWIVDAKPPPPPMDEQESPADDQFLGESIFSSTRETGVSQTQKWLLINVRKGPFSPCFAFHGLNFIGNSIALWNLSLLWGKYK